MGGGAFWTGFNAALGVISGIAAACASVLVALCLIAAVKFCVQRHARKHRSRAVRGRRGDFRSRGGTSAHKGSENGSDKARDAAERKSAGGGA